MPPQLDCSSSCVAFFPPAIYQSAGSSTVLPELLQSVDKDSVAAVQFLRNGAVRITFKSAHVCDRVVSAGIRFRDVPLRVVSVDARSRLVYLRDCPAEVPDDVVKRFFLSFGEVHSVSRSSHQAFPGIFDGNRVIKASLIKDVPGIVSIAGFECRVWYRRQPASCAICRKLGHRSRACPLNGLCRQCHHPGHHARACTNAWAPAAPASAVSSTPASVAVPPGPPPAPAAVSADAVDSPPPPAPAVVVASADVSVASPPGSVAASAAEGSEMSDADYLPQSGVESDDSASMDDVAASGDDEVVAAAPLSSLSDSPRSRRKRRRRTVSPAVPELVDMDTSVEEVPGHSYFRTFRGVWDDRFSWELYRSRKPRYKRVATPKPEPPPSSPSLFPSQDLSASSSTPVPPATPVPSCFFGWLSCRFREVPISWASSLSIQVLFREQNVVVVLVLLDFLGNLAGVSSSLGCFLLCCLYCCVVSLRSVSLIGLLRRFPCFCFVCSGTF